MVNKQFLDIFHLCKNDIYRLAYSYTKNQADADDIAQSVLIKLYNNFEKFNDEDHIKKWWIKVTVNECKNLFLSAWKRKILPITDKDETRLTNDNPKSENVILDAIESLPKKYRIVVHLYYYKEYKVSEIAKILNIKESTIMTQLFRARKILKEKLKEVWFDEE